MNYLRTVMFGAVAAAAALMPQKSNAQICRGEWSFSPVITVTNNVYGMAYGMLLNTATPYAWMPDIETRFAAPQSMDTPMGKAKISYWDWELRNLAVGYRVTYMSKTTPFGFSFRLNWEKRGLRTTMPEGVIAPVGATAEGYDPNYIYFNRQTISPEVLLRLRFGNYITARYNPILEIGGSYNFAVACKGLSQSTESINDGFRGVIGLGIGNTETHFQATVRYEYDFYNWFNEDWSPDGGLTHPYQGLKTNLGAVMLNVSFGF